VREDQSSGTALGVTVIRAVHQLIDNVPHILEDPISLQLIDTALRGQILQNPERYRSQSMRALRSHVVLRSRYAEDSLFEAVQSGVRQFVSLGAGYDTFAYRQPVWAQTLKTVEVDHPATQSSKIDLLRQKEVKVPENVEFLPLDFEKENLELGLARTALDPTLPVFVACLGVLAYLHVDTVRSLFRCIGKLPKLTRLVFTFAMNTMENSGQDDQPQTLSGRTAARGEPWLARFDLEDLKYELNRSGFSKVWFLDPSEAAAKYYEGRDDLPPPRKVTMGQAIV
jgi:methyltransferase (TIGR00027 family)